VHAVLGIDAKMFRLSSEMTHPRAVRSIVLAAAAAVSVWIAQPPARADERVDLRWQDDLAAMQRFRPGYPFWQHVFTTPDGSIAFGSAADGRLLATFPVKGDWARDGVWFDDALAGVLEGAVLPSGLDERRDLVAGLLEAQVGRVVHNPTRGNFLLPNIRRYGPFLEEWGAIYERFGVPATIGLSQAILESGLDGTRRSAARAIGFCQWLESNWKKLDQLSPHVLESRNQTTQAPYCAAYLSVLATRYGSFVPAVSEHHSGGTNVGRVLINGERLGGGDVRERYFLGSQAARELRRLDLYGYRDLYRTYGPRSYFYSEMVFGNTLTVESLRSSIPQARIYAMRVPRAVTLNDVVARSGIAAGEVRRYNPALVRQVPAGATLYLPKYVKGFGADVSFWHRPAPAGYARVLSEFLRLDASVDRWEDPAFVPVLREFQTRFRDSRSEEGTVMATVLAYVIADLHTSGRTGILAEFRTNEEMGSLLQQGMSERAVSPFAVRACGTESEEQQERTGSHC
jgi:hypothetical protein